MMRTLPMLAVPPLPLLARVGHVIARLANGAQRAAIFGRQRAIEVLGKVRRTQQGGTAPAESSP